VRRLRRARQLAAGRPTAVADIARHTAVPDVTDLVSHELRTPLSVIAGNLEMLIDGDAGALSPAQRRLLDIVDRNTHRLVGAVGDLLYLMAPTGRRARPLRRQVLVIQEIIARALRVAAAHHPTGTVTVRCEPATGPVRVYGDPDELTRMVVNLATIPGYATVDLVVRASGDRARLMVTLTPSGEAAPLADDRALRLAVASRIARRYGGIFTVCDAAHGGTTVTVVLPLLGTKGPTRRNTR
jgi:signal transduction histidine kinase